jgi:hypothetical protein
VTAATHSFKETSRHAASMLREMHPASDQHHITIDMYMMRGYMIIIML